MGPVHPTRMKPAPNGSLGVWRVGSGRVGSGRVGSTGFQNVAGRVGSGREIFKISRVESRRVGSRCF